MHKRLIIFILLTLLLVQVSIAQPPREVRAVWLTSVYNIDWPHSTSVSAQAQQDRLRNMLDVLRETNINTVLFQVRPNADALYQSAYEPWSEWITGTRGQVPDYDPLAFVIEESNKRGMEVHAWLNPYRFEITAGEYAGLPGDYSETHPELIFEHNDRTYFDPGNPATTQLIKNIVGDLVANYDLDGIVFDDYFYPSGLSNADDQSSYDTYGTAEFINRYYASVTRGNFRRASVNNMIKEVNDTIKAVDPGVIFGVSPAGIYSTQSSAATQWGTTLPSGISGADNYNSIYCDPLAWLDEQSIDYISPQLYWQIGGPQDYLTLVDWWGKEAARHDRHCYPSIGSYRLPSSAKSEPSLKGFPKIIHELKNLFRSESERMKTIERNEYTLLEIENQIIANRNNEENNVFGTIFFSTRDLTSRVPTLAPFLAEGVFAEKAIFPFIDWLPVTQPGAPQIAEIGTIGEDPEAATISVTSTQADRFLLLGWDNQPTKNEWGNADFMQVVFGRDFSSFYPGNKNFYAIAEFMPNREIGNISSTITYDPLATATITAPANNQTVCDPISIEWSVVDNADSYQVIISSRQDQGNIVFVEEGITAAQFAFPAGVLDGQEFYYVRIKAESGSLVSYSAPVSIFTDYPVGTQINTPAEGAQDVNLTTTVQWNSIQDINHYNVQVATDPGFTEESIVVNIEPVSLNFQSVSLEDGSTTHYVRVRGVNDCGYGTWSEPVSFTTQQGTSTSGANMMQLKPYPNPTQDFFTVQYPVSIRDRTISIYSVTGKIIRQIQKKDTVSTERFDFGYFPVGVYTVFVESPNQKYFFKIVKR